MSSKPRFLVVDDEPGWRDFLSYELSAKGYDVITAENASVAWEILHREPIDVILTDIRMPGSMDGLDMLARYVDEGARPKVIFMTGYVTDEKLLRALQYPSSVFLEKPFQLDDLLRAISELLVSLAS